MSLFNTIKAAIPPIHKEGYPFIAAFALASIVLGWLWSPLFYFGVALTIWCTLFFRDPRRIIPVSDDLAISPADGKVSFVGKVKPPDELGLGTDQVLRISVFMNVFSCHVNRSPMRGTIERIIYTPGSFLNAELDKASEQNERNALVVSTGQGDIAVVQIAGLIARRIVCWAKSSEDIGAGERFGLIRFGSRVDVYLPLQAKPAVSIGQTAVAGETILARFHEEVVIPLIRVD